MQESISLPLPLAGELTNHTLQPAKARARVSHYRLYTHDGQILNGGCSSGSVTRTSEVLLSLLDTDMEIIGMVDPLGID